MLLSRSLSCSIIAAEALHYRVRDGNGCNLLAIETSPKRGCIGCIVGCIGPLRALVLSNGYRSFFRRARRGAASVGKKGGQAARLISTGQLNTLLCLHLRPINLVVFQVPSVYLT